MADHSLKQGPTLELHQHHLEQVAAGDRLVGRPMVLADRSARMPGDAVVHRLLKAKEHHRASRVLLVGWKLGKVLRCLELKANGRHAVDAARGPIDRQVGRFERERPTTLPQSPASLRQTLGMFPTLSALLSSGDALIRELFAIRPSAKKNF